MSAFRLASRATVILAVALSACSDSPTGPGTSVMPVVPATSESSSRAPDAVPPIEDSVATIANRLSPGAPSLSAAVRAECTSVKRTHYKYNDFGYITRGVGVTINYCYNGSSVYNVSVSRWHREQYLWNWIDWTGTAKGAFTMNNILMPELRGQGYSYTTTGVFKQCAAYCYRSDFLILKVWIYANGTVVWDKKG